MLVNLIVLCCSLATFEVKSMIEDGFEYFESFWNKNDMMLFAMSIICLVQEFLNLSFQKRKIGRFLQGDEELLEEEEEEPDPPVYPVEKGFDYKRYYKAYDPHESILRVSYSLLIINTHVKTLNVLSFYSSVAFIIKAMQRVIIDI